MIIFAAIIHNTFNMKKLFLSVFALAIGAFAFVSCNDEKKGEGEDDGKYLSYTDQQDIITKSVSDVAQKVVFTDLADAVNTVIGDLVGKNISWKGIGEATEKDAVFAQKLNALENMLGSGQISFDFENMYFEADLAFRDSIRERSRYIDGEYVLVKDTLAVLYVQNPINHDADQFRLNLHTPDNHEVTLTLKGSNDDVSRVTYYDQKKEKEGTATLPDMLALSVTLDNTTTLLSANLEYDTDLKVRLEGTGFNFPDDEESDSEDATKVSYLKFEGEQLSLKCNLGLERYSVSANVDYTDRNGLNVEATAKISGNEVVKVNAVVDATVKDVNWADPSIILTSWLMNPEKFRAAKVIASVNGDEVKIVANIKENPFNDDKITEKILSLAAGVKPTEEDIKTLVDKLNEILNVEVYFKGYTKPQAKLKVVFEPQSGSDSDGDEPSGSDILGQIMNNISKSGLRILVDTYDADGKNVTITVEEYLSKIDVKTAGQTIVANFKQAFGINSKTDK